MLEAGWSAITVLDLSANALEASKARLGKATEQVIWIEADITRWMPRGAYDIWHNRAAFHFLTEADNRAAYVERLRTAVKSADIRSLPHSPRADPNAAVDCRMR